MGYLFAEAMISILSLIANLMFFGGVVVAGSWLVPSLRERFPKARLYGLSTGLAGAVIVQILRLL